jgi:hypothetical protein
MIVFSGDPRSLAHQSLGTFGPSKQGGAAKIEFSSDLHDRKQAIGDKPSDLPNSQTEHTRSIRQI